MTRTGGLISQISNLLLSIEIQSWNLRIVRSKIETFYLSFSPFVPNNSCFLVSAFPISGAFFYLSKKGKSTGLPPFFGQANAFLTISPELLVWRRSKPDDQCSLSGWIMQAEGKVNAVFFARKSLAEFVPNPGCGRVARRSLDGSARPIFDIR